MPVLLVLLFFTGVTLSGCRDGASSLQGNSAASAIQQRRPNLILIVADDLGYADIGGFWK